MHVTAIDDKFYPQVDAAELSSKNDKSYNFVLVLRESDERSRHAFGSSVSAELLYNPD
jgi:hypothetical protein